MEVIWRTKSWKGAEEIAKKRSKGMRFGDAPYWGWEADAQERLDRHYIDAQGRRRRGKKKAHIEEFINKLKDVTERKGKDDGKKKQPKGKGKGKGMEEEVPKKKSQ